MDRHRRLQEALDYLNEVSSCIQHSPFITHLIITLIWVKQGHVVAPTLFFAMEFYKGIIVITIVIFL